MTSDRRPGTPADVNWPELRARYERGESMRAIAKAAGVTHQAVSYRAKTEQWRVADDVQEDRRADVRAGWLERVKSTDLGAAADPRTLADLDPTVPAALYGRVFHPNAAAQILASVADGDGEKVAIALAGVEGATWSAWLKVDRGFEALVMAARASAAKKLRGKIMQATDYDWKAAQYLLEKTEETSGFVKEPAQQAVGGIVVNLNITRDESVALRLGVREPETIDVTPEK